MVYAAMMTAMGLSALNGSIVNTALTTIVGDLGGVRAYTWISTSYLLTSTAATPLAGKLSDLYGRKRLTQISITIFLVGLVLCSVAPNMIALVAARAIVGIGSGGVQAMSFVVIADIVPPRERGRYVGAFTSVFAVSGVAGPLIGGLIVDHLSWRWIFIVNVPFGLAALVMTQKYLRLPVTRRDTSIDVWGATLLVGGIGSFILTVAWVSDEYGWGSTQSLSMLTVSGLLLSALVLWEPHAENPMIPVHLFRNHTVQSLVPATTMISAVMTLVSTFMPLFLQAVTGVSPTNSGLLLVPMMIGLTFSSTFVGRTVTRTGHYRRWPILGTACGAVGLVLVSVISRSGWDIAIGLTGMLMIGLCAGASFPTSTTAIQNSVDIRDLGVASSFAQLCRSLGSVVALAGYGSLLNAQLSGRVDPQYLRAPRKINALAEPARSQAIDAMSHGITTVFKWAIPLMVIAFLFTLRVREIALRTHAAYEDPGSHHGSKTATVAPAEPPR